jgi:glycerol-3-phosphate acyltransferase PlsX
MKIAIDAMGGDFAPLETVLGSIEAVRANEHIEVVLVGDEQQIFNILEANNEAKNPRISVHHASQVIGMDEHPGQALRKKKDASVVVATSLVRDNVCDAVIAPGSTGAAVAAALFGLGRIKGVDRPVIATPMPTVSGITVMLDSGANSNCKPKHLCQSALMGSIYAKCMLGLENPAVGLLNIGEEATKGNEQAQATYPMLKSMKTINFKGNAEGRDVPTGQFDVVVCDGFVGNVVLKFAEGLAKTLVSLAKEAINKGGILAKLGALMLMPALKKLGKDIDVSEYGGAPLLGVNGCCIISHGSSNAKAICSAIRQASEFVQKDVITQIRDNIDKEEIWSHDTEVK